MAIISFWSGDKRQSGQTLSMAAIATQMCVEHNMRTLMIDATFDDDTLERAKNRLEVYYKETAPLQEYYEKTGALYTTTLSVKINRMKDEVAHDVIEYLKTK